jgi:hypothetical protein
VSIAPCLAAVETVVEHIVAHLYVANARLLVPVATITLEKD